jgi:hypothetical protein
LPGSEDIRTKEEILDLLDRGVAVETAAWKSATELAVPVLTATLTIIGSFLPLLLLSGAVGEFIRALPLAVAFALGSSYVVAMLLTPLLSRFFIRKGLHAPREDKAARKRRSPLDMMQRVYNATIVRAMQHKALTVVAGGAVFVCGLAILYFVPRQFFPLAARDQFVAGPQEEMVRVPQDDLRPEVLEIAGGERLHCATRADRHERRRLDDAMWRDEPTVAREPVAGDHLEPERCGHSGILRQLSHVFPQFRRVLQEPPL